MLRLSTALGLTTADGWIRFTNAGAHSALSRALACASCNAMNRSPEALDARNAARSADTRWSVLVAPM